MIEGEGDTAGNTSAPRTGGPAASEASDGGTGRSYLVQRMESYSQGFVHLEEEMRAAERHTRLMMDTLIASFPWWARVVFRISFAAARLHLAIGKFIGRLS